MPERTSAAGVSYVRDALTDAPVGLVIVNGQRRNAMTVSCFSEVAHHPTSMWISVARSAFTHELLCGTGSFTFATLHRGQADIAAACGTVSGRETDKCAALRLYEARDGFLFLEDALASTACRITRSVPLGDHTLFVAEMLRGEIDTRRAGERPLLLSDLRSR